MVALTLAGEHWSCGARAGLLFGALAVTAACQPALRAASRVMVETGGVDMVGFEVIGSWEPAAALVERWRASGREWPAARWSLVVDVPFLVAYGFGLWLLAAVVADHSRDRSSPRHREQPPRPSIPHRRLLAAPRPGEARPALRTLFSVSIKREV